MDLLSVMSFAARYVPLAAFLWTACLVKIRLFVREFALIARHCTEGVDFTREAADIVDFELDRQRLKTRRRIDSIRALIRDTFKNVKELRSKLDALENELDALENE
eukprot:Polyplicarium_translucidae@DN1729_c0_g1_i3.p5